MSAGVSELQRYSEHCGKAGELRAAFLRVGEEFIATVTPVSFSFGTGEAVRLSSDALVLLFHFLCTSKSSGGKKELNGGLAR